MEEVQSRSSIIVFIANILIVSTVAIVSYFIESMSIKTMVIASLVIGGIITALWIAAIYPDWQFSFLPNTGPAIDRMIATFILYMFMTILCLGVALVSKEQYQRNKTSETSVIAQRFLLLELFHESWSG